MRFNIRRMTESDIDTVYAIEKEVHIAPWDKKILRDCVFVGYDCRVFEIEVDNKVLLGGYVIARNNKETCHILNFCIAKKLQLKGYGRKFFQAILHSLAKTEHINYVVLEVRPSNKVALHLYSSMGFKPIEIKKAYYKEGEDCEDAIFLQKTLRT